MGEVVASIRDVRGGGQTIEGWLLAIGPAETGAIANRFCLTVNEARKALKKLERAGKVTSKLHNSWHEGWGGRVLLWQSTEGKGQP